MLNRCIWFCLVLVSGLSCVNAKEQEHLTVDRSIPSNLNLSFPNEDKINPKESDFEIVNYVLMSSEEGARWSVLTIKNTASGSRTLEEQHLMALFANGVRRSPLELALNFKGNETQSITVSFGSHKFPILTIYSNN